MNFERDSPNREQDALGGLQLLLGDMVSLELQHNDMTGKDNIQSKHVMVSLTKRIVGQDNECYYDLKMNDDCAWDGFYFRD